MSSNAQSMILLPRYALTLSNPRKTCPRRRIADLVACSGLESVGRIGGGKI